MTNTEAKARAVQSALCYAAMAAGSDAFQVDVQPPKRDGTATVVCYPYSEVQAQALVAFIEAFIWSDAEMEKKPFCGWVVTVTIKPEESK